MFIPPRNLLPLFLVQLSAFLVALSFSGMATANDGEPVAVIRLPDGGIAIESMWNLSVTIDAKPDSADDSSQTGTVSTDGVDIFRQENSVDQTQDPDSKPPKRFRVSLAMNDSLDMLLDRPANTPNPTWRSPRESNSVSPNSVHVQCHDNIITVTVDAVKIAHIAKNVISDKAKQMLKNCDVMVYDGPTSGAAGMVALAESNAVKTLILKSVHDKSAVRSINNNTLIVCASKEPASTTTQTIALLPTKLELHNELEDLFQRKERACQASQKVFAGLSTAQMNFRPSNGSHTPRWNTEHMMGRELLFFSQIYHAIDSQIPVMDLNPKQMPPDYLANHADWTGAEEAKQMERVSAFTRRFAYLLNGLPLDKKPRGSGWTPKRLFLQMERHYGEHTANVKKKFELPDWPAK